MSSNSSTSWLEYIPRLISIIFDAYFVYKDPSNDIKKKRFNNNVNSAFATSFNNSSNFSFSSASSSSSSNTSSEKFFTEDELKNKKDTKTDDESIQCKICLENKKCIVLIPCGHSDLCMTCSNTISKTSKKCPNCRKNINSRVYYYS